MECIECEEVITNPLCPHCLEAGIVQWLKEEGNDSAVQEVYLLRDTFHKSGLHCIKCSNPMRICAYCYTKAVFGQLRAFPELIQRFTAYFSFDLEHLGWEKEVEAYC